MSLTSSSLVSSSSWSCLSASPCASLAPPVSSRSVYLGPSSFSHFLALSLSLSLFLCVRLLLNGPALPHLFLAARFAVAGGGASLLPFPKCLPRWALCALGELAADP
eukprot:GHVT01090040.1.p4 GENE.GHVT01090040.1~~GHVT01090040.1.p4  ORF type:complete len:107 (+),score=19.04 GHVT01090040.1:317-637(+)